MDVSIDGYVGPDGRGGWAVVAGGRVVASGATFGEPSHLVEWRAAAAALAWLEGGGVRGEARLLTDSALVERGLASRKPAMSGEAAEVRAACRQALARLAGAGLRVRVERVPRERNVGADAAARAAAQVSWAEAAPDAAEPAARPLDADDEILVLLRQTEARERMLRSLMDADEDDDVLEPDGDACPHCGEPALGLASCDVCGEDGCLPRDDWRPGWGEPCLTRCSRCGVQHHVDCGGRSHEGNPVCLDCGPAMLRDEDA